MYPGKRLVDLVIALVVGLAALPVVALCVSAIRLASPGPAFYLAERAGLGERPFRQLKLRTMVVGADHAGQQTERGDARITPIGRLMRSTSLDELPQLLNVIRGDMSVVGPRPQPLVHLQSYELGARRMRSSVRPGITGLSQVSGRSDLSPERSLELDLEYVQSASLLTDLLIVVRTIGAVLMRSGTN